MRSIIRLVSRVLDFGITEDCEEDEKLTRRAFGAASLLVTVLAPFWGLAYIAYGEVWSGLIPSLYSVFTTISFITLKRTGKWLLFRRSQIVLIYLLPFALMLSLGGFVPGSAVAIWSVLAPLGALWGGRNRDAVVWVALFLGGTLISGLVDPFLRDSNNLPDVIRTTLFVLNISVVMGIVFLLVGYFVGQKDTLIDVMRRNRELESAYLQQEVSLRQSDKLATLGRLSAGLAHELNNPAAAVQQSTKQLAAALLGSGTQPTPSAVALTEKEQALLSSYLEKIDEQVHRPEFLGSLERSDRQDELETYLDDVNVDEPWKLAPLLVELGLTKEDVAQLAGEIGEAGFPVAVAHLANVYENRNLINGLSESADRIVELVGALKTYTHLDQAPRQQIDIHEGLDSTLVILQNELKHNTEVVKNYGADVPMIEAYGGELNQVWTNIVDNAIDAMAEGETSGSATIEIATRREGDQVAVDITDNGPGIPADVVDHVFDPFVTTKAPGDGSGLGLNISYNIVTQKHRGEISVSSRPGATTFSVRLPIAGPAEE